MAPIPAASVMTRAERIMAAAIIIRDAAEEMAYEQHTSAMLAGPEPEAVRHRLLRSE